MNHRSTDIFVVAALSLVAAVVALLVPPNIVPVRILTLPLVLVLPGYAMTAALFPRRELGVPERLVFILGLSLVIVILGGLMLNWTPFGLQASSWVVLLSVITLGASAVAVLRRRGQSLSAQGWLRIRNLGLTFRLGLLLGLTAVVLGGAIVLSSIGAAQQSRPGFTQLWILPASSSKNTVNLGMSNMELTAMEYRLVVEMDGKVVKVWPSIDLNRDQQWHATLVLPQTGHGGAAQQVEGLLYRANAPNTIYRHVLVWIDM